MAETAEMTPQDVYDELGEVAGIVGDKLGVIEARLEALEKENKVLKREVEGVKWRTHSLWSSKIGRPITDCRCQGCRPGW